ncbi:hypothetical protein Hanom_Chr09g00842821 [Helianthus anomalus]
MFTGQDLNSFLHLSRHLYFIFTLERETDRQTSRERNQASQNSNLFSLKMGSSSPSATPYING